MPAPLNAVHRRATGAGYSSSTARRAGAREGRNGRAAQRGRSLASDRAGKAGRGEAENACRLMRIGAARVRACKDKHGSAVNSVSDRNNPREPAAVVPSAWRAAPQALGYANSWLAVASKTPLIYVSRTEISCTRPQWEQFTFSTAFQAVRRLCTSVSMPVGTLRWVLGQVKNREAICGSLPCTGPCTGGSAIGLSATDAWRSAAAGDGGTILRKQCAVLPNLLRRIACADPMGNWQSPSGGRGAVTVSTGSSFSPNPRCAHQRLAGRARIRISPLLSQGGN
jgi:hypothetical protein